MQILEFARKHDCPWDELTFEMAAITSNVSILAWADAHGCPWNKLSCRAKVRLHGRVGSADVLKWIDQQ
tara:strand:+ start:1118 stop:1324 length:207 start_codon:yes stop_codon:yes gene_type:complete